MNILTFDIEEWFHIRFDNDFLDNDKRINSLEKRLDYGINILFDLLDKHNQKATFFCLGWVALNYPHIIKEIAHRGHTIGSHSDKHKLLTSFTEKDFEDDLKRSLDSIESLIGEKIIMYRAPAFSIGDNNKWVFDILIHHGIEIDSSIFPAKRDFGGFAGFEITKPLILNTESNKIKEFPMNLFEVFSRELIFSGGGYFRFLPYFLIQYMMKNSKYVMTYFHPRDFDKDQPILEGLSLPRYFKSYYGLGSSFGKLDKLLTDFDFLSISEADKKIDWLNSPRYNL